MLLIFMHVCALRRVTRPQCCAVQRIRGYFYNEMRYINLRLLTYLLTYTMPRVNAVIGLL